jgi:hypothetical protein
MSSRVSYKPDTIGSPHWLATISLLIAALFSKLVLAEELLLSPRKTIVMQLNGRIMDAEISKKADRRLKEELDLMELELVEVDDGEASDETWAARCEKALSTSSVQATFSISQTDQNQFWLYLAIADYSGQPVVTRELPLDLPPNASANDTVEILALRTAEALKAALLVGRPHQQPSLVHQDSAKITITIDPKPIYPKRGEIRLKATALAGLISGGLALGAAGVLHYQKCLYEDKANDIATSYNKRVQENEMFKYTIEYNDMNNKYKENARISTQFRYAAIAAYATGGVLTAAGVALGAVLVYRRHNRERPMLTVRPTNGGINVSF